MKCLEREKLARYSVHLLESHEETEVRAHLAECAACRETLEGYRRLGAVLDEWVPRGPSPGFDARVQNAIRQGEAERFGFRLFDVRWVRWLAPALAVVVVAVASVVVLRWHPSGKVSAPPAALKPAATTATAVSSAATFEPDEEELKLYQNLPVLENYDLLADFDVLSELPKGEAKLAN